jgi:hypothetical protein
MTGWTWTALLASGTVLATAACEGFKDMASLRPALIEEFHAPDAVLTLAMTGHLTVTLQNLYPELDEGDHLSPDCGVRAG